MDQLIQTFGIALAGGSAGVALKALFDRRKTRAEAGKSEADAESVTIQALRQLVMDLMGQVSALNSQYGALHQANASLAIKNAEQDVELAVLREINHKLKEKDEQRQAEREEMMAKILALEEHVRRLERAEP